MNNVYDISRKSESLDEASNWLARLDRELTSEESEALQKWLAADPVNPEVLLEVARVWDRMDMLSRLAELFPELISRERTPAWRPALATAAIFLVAVLAGFWTMPNLVPEAGDAVRMPTTSYVNSRQVFQTAVGEQSTVNLSDGTQLTLNTNTLVKVAYSSSERRLDLKRGEVYIQVARDKSRPLNLHVGGKVVRAVGTAFNVKITQDQRIEVIVTEGKVLVAAIDKDAVIPGRRKGVTVQESRRKPVAISSGEKMLVGESDEQVNEVKPEEIDVSLSWRGGNLIFRGESLAEALAEIERYTPVEFVIVDENLKKLRVVGLFKAGDVEGLLTTLRDNFDIGYERINDDKVLLTKDNK